MKLSKYFNIFDFNIVLCLVGFMLFTTFVDNSFLSIVYRAFALGISLICLSKTGLKIKNNNKYLRIFFVIFVLCLLKVTYYAIMPAPSMYHKAQQGTLIWGYGVTLFPLMAVLASSDRLHQRSILLTLYAILVFSLIMGLKSNVGVSENVRMELNAHQSTLTFGDKGSMLAILSLAFLNDVKSWKYKLVFTSVFILSLLLGLFCVLKAASRGPFLSVIVGLLVVVFCSTKKVKIVFTSIFVGLVAFSASTLKYFSEIAPLLFLRMVSTTEDGDTSGRDVIFQEALDIMNDHPILGGNPTLFLETGEFTSHHNCYLSVGVALGYIGMIAYLLLISIVAFKSVKYHNLYNDVWNWFFLGMYFFFITRSITGVYLIDSCDACICLCMHFIGLYHIKLRQQSELVPLGYIDDLYIRDCPHTL